MEKHYWGQTYIMDEEMVAIQPLLKAAVEFQESKKEFLMPDSYWTDKNGKLYIRWRILPETVKKSL